MDNEANQLANLLEPPDPLRDPLDALPTRRRPERAVVTQGDTSYALSLMVL